MKNTTRISITGQYNSMSIRRKRLHNARFEKGSLCHPRATAVAACAGGFTLFELLLILFIISFFMALAMPSLSILGESGLKSDARRLAAIVRYLHDSSITAKESYSLTMDFGEKIVTYAGPDGERRESIKTVVSAEMMTQGSVSKDELTLFFRPTGGSEAFRILLADDNTSLVISFNPLSGRAKIVQNNT